VLVHHDTDLYDLKVRTGRTTSVIDTTSNHLFWVPAGDGGGGRWVKAGSLKYGIHLRTPGSRDDVTVLGGWAPTQRDGWMWDLTVPGNNDHDFYVQAADTAVLVHNCTTGGARMWLKEMADQVRMSGLHPAAINQRTIAVGMDSAGNLFAGSSNGFDAGQRTALEMLGISRVPGVGMLHAEEELVASVPDLERIGVSGPPICGPESHNCLALLTRLSVQTEQ
jgi:hypothetical protein